MKRSVHLMCAIAIHVVAMILVTPLLHAQFDEYNFDTPENVGDLVFNFFHHSVGGDLLNRGLRSRLEGLGYTLHSQTDVQYEYENNNTDYRHWYKRFQRELGIRVGDGYYRYQGPGVAPTQEIPPEEFMLTWYEYRAETMDIIMFKPCFPGSAVSSYDTSYGAGGNVIGGTPYSDNGVNNFTYLNSGDFVDDGYADTHWTHGGWWDADSSLAQLKVVYRGMLNIFVEHPDLLFIAMQGPPMVYLTNEQAHNCREFARWLREDWLREYDPTGTDTFQDYPLTNVCAFDFQSAIGWTGDDPVLDGQYAWFPVGGFPDDALDTTITSRIGRSANDDPGDDHPEPWLDQRAAVLLCGGTDTYSGSHNPGQPQRSYHSWINAMVNRWQGGGPLLTAPSNLRSTADSSNRRIVLTWDDNSDGEDSFIIQRDFNDEGWVNDFASVGPNVETYADTGLAFGNYQYRIVAHLDDDGTGSPLNSAPSNIASAVISVSAPTAPSDLVSSVQGADIVLVWSDNSNNEDSFIVERAVNGGAFVVFETLPANTETFRDSGLGPGTYDYRVMAHNDMGDSGYSNAAEETITDVSPTLYVDGSVLVSGDGTPERPLKRIQEGIDAASDEHTVIVAPGTYAENIDFGGKNIVLRSSDPTNPTVVANTIIDGSQAGSVVTFAGTELESCVLSGFTVRNGRVVDADSGGIGGGDSETRSRATIEHNVITGNTAGWGGGLAYCGGRIQNNTISSNSVIGDYCSGGGLFECNGTILNNIISANSSAGDGGGLAYCGGEIRDNKIIGNAAVLGGGLFECSGLIENNTVTDNSATDTGGGLAGCNATIRNNIISCNTAVNSGGGLSACPGTIQGNVIAANSARQGGGLAGCDNAIRNNTIANNAAANQGGGLMWCYGIIVNCVIWGNTATQGSQLYESSEPTYSCIQGWTAGGEGNIADAPPQFTDPDGPDDDPGTCEDNDYHLAEGSPCVDAGSNEDWMAGAVDLDGNPRILNGTVEMGAYEYGHPGFAFEVTELVPIAPDSVQLSWNSRSGDMYVVSWCTDLATGEWAEATTIASGGGTTTWTDTDSTPARKFYRIEIE